MGAGRPPPHSSRAARVPGALRTLSASGRPVTSISLGGWVGGAGAGLGKEILPPALPAQVACSPCRSCLARPSRWQELSQSWRPVPAPATWASSQGGLRVLPGLRDGLSIPMCQLPSWGQVSSQSPEHPVSLRTSQERFLCGHGQGALAAGCKLTGPGHLLRDQWGDSAQEEVPF